MARKSNFDKNQKLLEAMALFWRKGYANTAISDLVDTLQINRFSLYNSFGDKQNLYYMALDAYLEKVSLPPVTSLTGPSAGWPELKTFLIHFANKQKDSSNGCFMQNAIVEHGGEDEKVLMQGNRLFDLLSEHFCQALTNAQQQKQLSASLVPAQLASLLLSQMQGMRVLSKAKRHQDIDAALDAMISLIEGAPHERH